MDGLEEEIEALAHVAPKLRDFTGLGRRLDPAYPANRAVLLLMPVMLIAGSAAGWIRGATVPGALVGGLELALLAFASWALTRELAPDDESWAFLSLGLGAGTALAADPSVLVLVVALLVARLVNRSTGTAAGPVGSASAAVGFLAAGWWLTWTGPVIGGLALIADGTMDVVPGQPKRARHVVLGLGVLVAGAPLWLDGLSTARPPDHPRLIGILAALGLLAAALYPAPRSVGDRDGDPLDARRARVGAALGVAAVAMTTIDPAVGEWGGSAGWGCVSVTIVARIVGTVRDRVAARA